MPVPPMSFLDSIPYLGFRSDQSDQPQVYTWLRQHHYAFKNKTELPDDAIQTHGCFDAMATGIGVACVPDAERNEFYKQYAISLIKDAEIPLYMNELGPSGAMEPRPIFFDFDFHLKGNINFDIPTVLLPIFHELQKIIVSTLPVEADAEELAYAIVQTGGFSYTAEKDDTKLGLHMFWPRVCITLQQHLDLRATIVSGLENTFDCKPKTDSFECTNEWNDIIDRGPCATPMMRMFGSRKLVVVKRNNKDGKRKINGNNNCCCPDEWQVRRRGCRCYKGILRDAGRPYVYCATLKKDGSLHADHLPRIQHSVPDVEYDLLCLCSLRRPGASITTLNVTESERKGTQTYNCTPTTQTEF